MHLDDDADSRVIFDSLSELKAREEEEARIAAEAPAELADDDFDVIELNEEADEDEESNQERRDFDLFAQEGVQLIADEVEPVMVAVAAVPELPQLNLNAGEVSDEEEGGIRQGREFDIEAEEEEVDGAVQEEEGAVQDGALLADDVVVNVALHADSKEVIHLTAHADEPVVVVEVVQEEQEPEQVVQEEEAPEQIEDEIVLISETPSETAFEVQDDVEEVEEVEQLVPEEVAAVGQLKAGRDTFEELADQEDEEDVAAIFDEAHAAAADEVRDLREFEDLLEDARHLHAHDREHVEQVADGAVADEEVVEEVIEEVAEEVVEAVEEVVEAVIEEDEENNINEELVRFSIP